MGIVRTIIDQPEEFSPLVQMAWAAHKAKRLPKDPNLAFCYDMLNRVSRRCFHGCCGPRRYCSSDHHDQVLLISGVTDSESGFGS